MDICRGQRLPLAQLLDNHAQLFHVELSISGVIIDFVCFGLNTNSKWGSITKRTKTYAKEFQFDLAV